MHQYLQAKQELIGKRQSLFLQEKEDEIKMKLIRFSERQIVAEQNTVRWFGSWRLTVKCDGR